ncbi:TetR/AcrR family transcriptional regulator [Caldibacillus lycopersici]|uniref:TetR/AcrR family transcriptional regulator n=1 Tax=Perspicuibacillus lycopersici TaxID=1325689 RepID=A0AAE3IYK1_9BACI|nr:TetR/AcrR family transcriptional regulator [Perspicuibacillus lycopersici]MCU9614415.1 TetR/AcrR family transcriptional regulator [Perspicuibacillus lycopersici]
MIIDRRINKSKSALKDALLQLMEEKDFRKITITDLVNISNLNRGTFYKHYQSKEELLDELIDDVIHDLVHSYREPYLHTDKFAISELTSGAVKIFEHVASYAKFYTIIVNSNVLPGFQNKICDVLKQLSLLDLQNVINVKNTINRNLYSSYTSYALFGLIVEWVKEGFIYSTKYMADQLIEIISYSSFKPIIDTSKKSNVNQLISSTSLEKG